MNLKGHRWFIWTLVFLIVAGVALVTYINYTSADQGEFGPWLTHHAKTTKQVKK